MRVSMVAFTATGVSLAQICKAGLARKGHEVYISASERLGDCEPGVSAYASLGAWVKEAWERSDALVFVGALGIAARSVAPLVADKFLDPAVVCVDERGSFAISVLSGHVGGANELARQLATVTGGVPVITTATDVNEVFAVDVWAKGQNLCIVERDVAKEVSARLLEGGCVGVAGEVLLGDRLPRGLLAHDAEQPGDDVPELGILVGYRTGERPFARTLHLVPAAVTVGLGCRRGVTAARVARAVDECLAELGIPAAAVRGMATIDVKQDECGLTEFAASRNWPLRYYAAAELEAVEGNFSSSTFVQRTVGVDNVCERAACAGGGRLLMGKHARDGVTVALAAGDVRPVLGTSLYMPADGGAA